MISFLSSLATGLFLFTAGDHGIPFGSIHREFLTLGYEREARSLCQYGKNGLKTPVNAHVAPREERLSLDGQPSWKEKLALWEQNWGGSLGLLRPDFCPIHNLALG